MSHWVVLCLCVIQFSFCASAHAGDEDKKKPSQHELDVQRVALMREFLETKYVGKFAITPEMAEAHQQYIDHLMQPLDALLKGQLPKSVSMTQVAGPTGEAKSSIAMDWAELMIRFDFMKQERYHLVQGAKDKKLDFSLFERFKVEEKDLKADPGLTGYDAVRNIYVKTGAFIHFDEATDFMVPIADLDKGEADALRAARLPADRERIAQEFTQLRRERLETYITLRKIWQAMSGGKYYASEIQKLDEEMKKQVAEAYRDIVEFRAAHQHHPLLAKFERLGETLSGYEADLGERSARLKALQERIAMSKRRHGDFKGLRGDSVDAWLAENGKTEEMKQTRLELVVPALVAPLVDAHKEKEGFYPEGTAGHTPNVGGSAPTQRYLENVGKAFEHEIAEMEREEAELVTKVLSAKKMVQKTRAAIAGFADIQTEVGGDPRALLADWTRLHERRFEIIKAAAKTSSAQYAIQRFLADLDAAKLKERYPTFYKRLVDVEHVNVDKWLDALRLTRSVDVKFAAMMKMAPETTVQLIHDANTKDGFETRPEYFGGVRLLKTMNLKDEGGLDSPDNVEGKVAAAIDAELRRGGTLTRKRLREIYKQHVPENWPLRFIKKYVPGFFRDNPLAEGRRVSAAEGAIFIPPPSADQLVNNVATTIESEFREWKLHMAKEGFDVSRARLYLHENVPPYFVTDHADPRRGTNAVLNPVKQRIGALLTALSKEAYEKRQAAGKEGKPFVFDPKLVLVNTPENGHVSTVALHYLTPIYAGKKPVIKGKPPTVGDAIGTFIHKNVPSTEITIKVAEPIALDESGETPLTVAEHEAGVAAAKKAADEKVAAAAEAARLHEENAAKAAKTLAEEKAREAETAALHKTLSFWESLRRLLASKPTAEQLREFHLKSEDARLRAEVPKRILQWIKEKNYGAKPEHLFHWLGAEADAGRRADVDKFVDAHSADGTLQEISPAKLTPRFASLVLDEATEKKVREALRPSPWWRFIGCRISFGWIRAK